MTPTIPPPIQPPPGPICRRGEEIFHGYIWGRFFFETVSPGRSWGEFENMSTLISAPDITQESGGFSCLGFSFNNIIVFWKIKILNAKQIRCQEWVFIYLFVALSYLNICSLFGFIFYFYIVKRNKDEFLLNKEYFFPIEWNY